MTDLPNTKGCIDSPLGGWGALYSSLFYTKNINDLFSVEESIAQMLRFEVVLAKAQADCGIIPKSAAEAIETHAKVENIDIEKLIENIELAGNAAIPLVKQLTTIIHVDCIKIG